MSLVAWDNFGVAMFSLNSMEKQSSTMAEILNGLLPGAVMVIHSKKKAIVVLSKVTRLENLFISLNRRFKKVGVRFIFFV